MPTYPPGNLWRGTIAMKHKTGQGFVETWWLKSASRAAAAADIVLIANARVALFDSTCMVNYWKVSDPRIRGDAEVRTATEPTTGSYGTGTPPVTDMSPANVQLHCRMGYIDAYWASRGFRMIPEALTNSGFVVSPLAAWDTPWLAFVELLKAKTVGLFKEYHEGARGPALLMKDLTDVTPLRISTHKTGRPFGLLPARSVLR